MEKDKSVFVFGHISHLFKCINTNDRLPYVMRRIDGVPLIDEAAFGFVDKWGAIHHPAIVNFREAFTTTEFNDNCMYIILLLYNIMLIILFFCSHCIHI